MRIWPGFVCTLFLVTRLGADESAPSVDAIITEALERQKLHDEAGNDVRFDYELVTVSEKLDKTGEVKNTEHELYRSHHIDGVVYEKLAEKDGQPLSDKEQKREKKREEKFRKKLRKAPSEREDDDEQVRFDRDLLDRYDIELEETKPLNGRDTFVLSFHPKSGKLPKKNKFDAVLNNAHGELLIDRETYELAGLRFDVDEKVKLWWGVLGSVSKMSGTLVRAPVDDSVWLPRSFDFYMRGRIFFRSLHLRQRVAWSKFQERSTVTTMQSSAQEEHP